MIGLYCLWDAAIPDQIFRGSHFIVLFSFDFSFVYLFIFKLETR